MEEQELKPKKVKPITVVISVLVILVIIIGSNFVFLYGLGEYNKFTQTSSRLIPFPAATIGTKIVKMSTLKSNLMAIKKFYESQDFSAVGMRIDFSTIDGQKRLMIREKDLLNKLIEDAVIEKLTRENGKTVSDDIVNQNVDRSLEEYQTGKSVEETLKKLYGWTLSDFKEKIIRPKLYRDELEKIYRSDENVKKMNNEKASLIRQAKDEIDQKKDFSEIVRKYSDGVNNKKDGDLGWFKEEQLIFPVGKEVAGMNVSEVSEIIESDLGYHIVELLEKKEESESQIYHIRQIFVAKYDFASWLTEKMKTINIKVYSKNYYWDKNSLEVKFRDGEMAKFEQKVLEQFQGDPSVIY
jgi:parvulin-like peptidyl-prolyl isomerase